MPHCEAGFENQQQSEKEKERTCNVKTSQISIPSDRDSNISVEAVIADVIPGKGFAITYLRVPTAGIKEWESVTFSLNKWQGKLLPEPGQVVLLELLQRFDKGWRAGKASPITPQQ